MSISVKKKLLNDKPPLSPSKYAPTGPFLVNAKPSTDINKNTSWFDYPGVWTMYILICISSWLMFMMLFNVTWDRAWTMVHLIHFVVTYYFFHWKKGSPFSEDQGVYDKLTWWEQVDSGKQLTRNRKFLTVLPVVLYLLATHEDFDHPIFIVNTITVAILLIAKLPSMHKVRILGINADYPT
eukprot:TRINITY_DN21569_c0_g1_i1.p1 TRINITY_DN21569_c0_g1~~TRINITY_DN21569_c0_g1_i1.p1  ORF type:complete len:182 (+),score=26.56 TRINITY_DN21569_c0_g1_i1:147-692(+)